MKKAVKIMLVTEHCVEDDLKALDKDELLGILLDPTFVGCKPEPLLDENRRPTGQTCFLFQFRHFVNGPEADI